MLSTYRRDMQRAWNRIHDVPAQRLHTRFGTVEYAERGEGLPILNCHGVLGCHADGVDGWWTNMLGAGYRVISPSRFGYFGSTPTLIVSAVDDHWAPYRYAVTAAEHIPGAKLVTIEQGGHLFLRHDAQVRTAVGTFIASVTQREGEGR